MEAEAYRLAQERLRAFYRNETDPDFMLESLDEDGLMGAFQIIESAGPLVLLMCCFILGSATLACMYMRLSCMLCELSQYLVKHTYA